MLPQRVLIIAFLGAALIFLVRLFEMKYLTGEIPMKLYMLLIGGLFAGIGIWVGLQFRKRAAGQVEAQPLSVGESQSVPVGESQPVEAPALPVAEASTQIHPSSEGLLTARETELIQLLAAGLSNKEIAERIFVSENTVKKHLGNIYRKLEVSRRTQAVSKARELGIVGS